MNTITRADQAQTQLTQLTQAFLEGRDALGIFPRGVDPAACYVRSSLTFKRATVVVTPRELSVPTGTAGPPLLFVSPGRFITRSSLAFFRLNGVARLVIEEAHRTASAEVATMARHIGRPPILAITSRPSCADMIVALLDLRDPVVVLLRGGGS